ncbi:MAG: carbohydrate binding domain-containing protein [Opitutaceae bacterium]|nr:carbohydrate binding domain-containing protein [Opitutaceae bacterium]
MSPRTLAALSGFASLCSLNAFAAGSLQSFRMPWNDSAATVTSLQGWQVTEAGASGWVTVNSEGHYLLNGQRIRFLGVNIGDASAFPTTDRADGHAARLAKFGFNAVRFHHLEAPWESSNVIIDYASGSSRNLSAARLDRLHYFVNALAKKGIYSNINLLVSREFKPADGLGSEITQLGWKDQHILGFFHDGALDLHKEHATKLLTAPNPYRAGKSLALDPAVAFVEINNETGMLQKWHEGVLDKLPAPYLAALQQKWNQWLQSRYNSEGALLTAWGSIDQPLGTDLVKNGNFNGNTTSWTLEQHSTAKATATADTGYNGGPAVTVAVTTKGTEGWHVQLVQSGFAVTADQVYTFTFSAKSSTSAPLSASVARAGGDYGALGPSVSVTLTNTWQEFSLPFLATSTEANARVVFNGFGAGLNSVQISNVSLKPGGKIGGLLAGESLSAGSISTVKKVPSQGAASGGQARDWIRFLIGRDKSYWEAMENHVKQTLGYKGIMWATIISNSPPNAQAGMDAIDSHSYWQHPVFPPGQDWSPEEWTVNNASMVNNPAGSTLAGVARQRVKGMPHNLTEYQHASPNTYGSEGPLLSAAYAALQDWDSLWMFAYTTTTAEFVTGFFDHGGHAGKMANNLLAAALFRRGDVAPAQKVDTLAFTPETEVEAARTKGAAWSVADGSHLGIPATLFAVNRIALAIGEAAQGPVSPPAAPSGNVLTSDTGELVWDLSTSNKGIVKVNTPRTKAVIGHVNGRTFTLGDVTIKPGDTRQDWCTIGLTMLGDGTFGDSSSGRALLVATGDQENTGQIWKSTSRTSVGTKWGSAPTLVEVIPATITLPYSAGQVKVWALDGTGARGNAVTVRDSGGKAEFDIGSSGATLWYELVIGSGDPAAPVITVNPSPQVTAAGATATFTVSYAGEPAPTFQWYKDNVAIPGATTATLALANVSSADIANYHVVITNSMGTATSLKARLLLAGSFNTTDSTLANLSTRSPVGKGDNVMIAGFTLEGGTRKLLVRATGPKLGSFGVPGTLADPYLEIVPLGTNTPLFTNNDWSSTLAPLFPVVGAFGWDGSPKESAVLEFMPNGSTTAIVKGMADQTGVALVEVYDTGEGAGRVLNLATRATVGEGANALFVGFMIKGEHPMKLLIRGVGPGLAALGVPGTVGDPVLTLYRMNGSERTFLARNDRWSQWPTAIAPVASTVTFALPAGSEDAAMVLWLEPGVYSAQIEAKQNSGIGMVEVYEVD